MIKYTFKWRNKAFQVFDLENPIQKADIEAKDLDEYLDLSYSRQGQDVRYALNDDKLRSLGWKPVTIFYKELPDIVEYYKNNFIW